MLRWQSLEAFRACETGTRRSRLPAHLSPPRIGALHSDPTSRPHESLSGLIKRVTFFNGANGGSVLKVKAKPGAAVVTDPITE